MQRAYRALRPGASDIAKRACAAIVGLGLLREHLEVLFSKWRFFDISPGSSLRQGSPPEEPKLLSVRDIRKMLLEYRAYRSSDEGAEKIGVLTHRVLSDTRRYIEFIRGSEEEQRRAVGQLPNDRVIKSQVAISHFESDQDLIACLGKLFHVSVRDIDAYTGSIYTSECIGSEEELFRDAFLAFPMTEMKAYVSRMEDRILNTLDDANSISRGDIVRHTLYREGVVLVKGDSEVAVRFDESGKVKTLMTWPVIMEGHVRQEQ